MKGRKGRNPVPTELKVMRGNPGHRPLNELEPKPEPGVPVALEHLTPRATELFNKLVDQLTTVRLLTVVDGPALSALAQSIADYEQATNELAHGEKVVKTERGTVKSPWFTIQKQAFDQMNRGFADFGLTPSSRSSLKTIGKAPAQSEKEAKARRFFGAKPA